MQLENFKLDAFLAVANELVRADEIEKALKFLTEYLPAYYRDFIPSEVVALKQEIQKRVATAAWYASHSGDELLLEDPYIHEDMVNSLRGRLIVYDVKQLNERGFKPHVVDCGPGTYWLARLLDQQGCKFTYKPIWLNKPSHEKFGKYFKQFEVNETPQEQPIIYVACEIIEHLWNEEEVRFEMMRNVGLADIVHVSTPCYSFDYRDIDWRSRGDLGHLRAYTPNEAFTKIGNMFPEYTPYCYRSQILHVRSVLRFTKFSSILATAGINTYRECEPYFEALREKTTAEGISN